MKYQIEKRYDWFKLIINLIKPQTICEVGVHNGNRAKMMSQNALSWSRQVHYEGYDLWEQMPLTGHEVAYNGKGASKQEDVHKRLQACGTRNFTYQLHEGDTEQTLREGTCADLVFIDGDHRIASIQRDYERVRTSPHIVFDDYYDPEIPGMGCNRVSHDKKYSILLLAEDRERWTLNHCYLLLATDDADVVEQVMRYENARNIGMRILVDADLDTDAE